MSPGPVQPSRPPTAARTLAWVAVGATVLSALLWTLLTRDGALVPLAPWLGAAVLVALGVSVLVLAWPVRAYVRGRTARIDALRAARVVVLAQASALTGSAALGWYVGQALVVASGWELVANQERMPRLAVMVLASVLLLVAGLVAQSWCRLPPGDPHERREAFGEGGGDRVSGEPA